MSPDKPYREKLDEALLDAPDDPPEVVPAISAEQPGVGATIGVGAFADNDEASHVQPTDNDGETVPPEEA